jgi:hypothetical protein
MQTINLTQAGQTSDYILAPGGSRVTLSGSGSVKFAPGTLQDAKEGRLTFRDWPIGSTAGFCDLAKPVVMYVVATGTCTVTVQDGSGRANDDEVYWVGADPVGESDNPAIPVTATVDTVSGGIGISAGSEVLLDEDEFEVLREIAGGGNIAASVQPRSGLLANLLALDGLNGEWSHPTDVPACAILHNGVAGGAVVFARQGGIPLVVTDAMVGALATTYTIPAPYSNITFTTSDSLALLTVRVTSPLGAIITVRNNGGLSFDIETGATPYTLGTDSAVAFIGIGSQLVKIAEVVV